MKLYFLYAFLIASSAALSAEETILLPTGESLSGTVQSISEDSTLTLAHSSSKTPLKLNLNKLSTISFPELVLHKGNRPETMVHLNNGDSFPASLLEINLEDVTLQSNVFGKRVIKREDIDSIRFGSSIEHNIFDLTEVKRTLEKNNNWIFDGDNLTTNQTADMWEEFPLTSNFIIRGKLNWTENPSLQLSLAAMSNTPDANNSRYDIRLQNNQVSAQLFTNKHRVETKNASALRLSNYQGSVSIEILVSQAIGRVTVRLNNKDEHAFDFPRQPNGSFIGITNFANSDIKISNFSISTWDGKVDPKSVHLLGSKKKDFIRTRIDSQLSGKILASELSEDGKMSKIPVEYGHTASGPFLINKSDIQIIKFAKSKPTEKSTLKPSILFDGSTLSFDKIYLTDEIFSLNHPLLGEMKIPKKKLKKLHINQ